ncbi:MAG: flagellar biosynthetic protein FliQ [Planctomycetes bacterium]|nr:flagellar biosynthetic protein FliQ [Planctomycetota bacterium]MCC7169081.1 flagellar biosynthetic protein FliQ [Planctomycetota bacterium]
MDPDFAVELARHTLLTALTIAAPLLAATLLLALVLALVQTILNLQEQTLTVIPKIVIAVLVTFLLTPWVLRSLIDFTVPMLGNMLSNGAGA